MAAQNISQTLVPLPGDQVNGLSRFSSSGRVMLRAPLTETLTTHCEAHKLSICQLSLLVIRRRFCLSGAMTPLLRFCAWMFAALTLFFSSMAADQSGRF